MNIGEPISGRDKRPSSNVGKLMNKASPYDVLTALSSAEPQKKAEIHLG
jgi:hypothetical protein